jgi:hypothetical protein
MPRLHPLLALPLFAIALCLQAAETGIPARTLLDGPDPREVPLPIIRTEARPLPPVEQLPQLKALPDPLRFSDGSRVGDAASWARRRAELREILAWYAVGQMPPAPDKVTITELQTQEQADTVYRRYELRFGPGLRLEMGLLCPKGPGPFPVVLFPAGTPPGATPLPLLPKGPGQGKGQNALLPAPSSTEAATPQPVRALTLEKALADYAEPLSRGYAVALFNHNDFAEDTTLRLPDGSWAFRSTRFPAAYPGYDWGILGAWAWGASRIADGLVQLPCVDAGKLIISGVSRTGKAALIAAAFDERLHGAPVVTGGGGMGAYRFSGIGRGGREGLPEMMNKYPNWFSPQLRQFWGHTDQLPFDAHWFLALCAPRPFIALEGDTDTVSLPNAVKQSILGARPVYKLLGAEDRLGVNYGHHGHALTGEDWKAMLEFFDDKLRGLKSGRHFDQFLPEPTPTVLKSPYNLHDFGAVGDGLSKDTRALQRALDTCAVTGGGEVLVPAGRYLIGSVQLGAHSTLRLEEGAVLVGSPDLEDYPLVDVRWEGRFQPGHRALIYAANVDDIAIIGPGRIEGDAGVAAGQNPRGAVVLEALNCRRLRWEKFQVSQGGNWATHPTLCEDVEIKGLVIRGKRDGIDIDSCSRVLIEDCDIDTGDDAISLKSGRGMDGARLGRPTEDVLIRNCTLSCRRFACIGIGSETSGGIRRVRIEHCRFPFAGTHAIYIKTRIGRAGVIEDISGEDLDISAGSFLRINLISSGNTNTADDPVEGLLGYPVGRRFRFSRVHVACKSLVEATQISAERPLEGLELSDITGNCDFGLRLENIQGVKLERIQVTGFKGPLLEAKQCPGL